jgi:hypothetical protein
VSRWQPIESAPKDGTAVLIFVPDMGNWPDRPTIVTAFWNGGLGWCDNAMVGCQTYGRPTHWMPLPAPPRMVDLIGLEPDAKLAWWFRPGLWALTVWAFAVGTLSRFSAEPLDSIEERFHRRLRALAIAAMRPSDSTPTP